MGVYLPCAGTLHCAVWPGAGIACSQDIPPDFYPPHVNVGLPVSVLLPALCAIPRLLISLFVSLSLPLVPVWMNVASLMLDFHTV